MTMGTRSFDEVEEQVDGGVETFWNRGEKSNRLQGVFVATTGPVAVAIVATNEKFGG